MAIAVAIAIAIAKVMANSHTQRLSRARNQNLVTERLPLIKNQCHYAAQLFAQIVVSLAVFAKKHATLRWTLAKVMIFNLKILKILLALILRVKGLIAFAINGKYIVFLQEYAYRLHECGR